MLLTLGILGLVIGGVCMIHALRNPLMRHSLTIGVAGTVITFMGGWMTGAAIGLITR